MAADAAAGDPQSVPRVAELLVPVDLSHESWRVLPLARWIGDELSAAIVPLYVDASSPAAGSQTARPVVLRTSVAGTAVAVQVLPGADTAAVIEQRAQRGPGSVVVMSTHGHGSHPERAWGELCDRLLMADPAGILAVGPHFDADRNASVKRVAVCIDAAAPDHEIVQEALAWADRLNVPLVVVTVKGHGRSRPGEDDTYHVIASVFEELPPARVSVTAEALDDLDVAPAICRFGERQAGTLLALAPGAAPRAVHSMTHSVTMAVARETRNAMLLRWHRGESGDAT